MAYATVQELKAYLKIQSTRDDELLTSFIDSAQAIIEDQTHRVFELPDQDETREYDIFADVARNEFGRIWTLYLKHDLYSVTSIVTPGGATLQASDYVTTPRDNPPYYQIILKSNSSESWLDGSDTYETIKVTGRWSYSAQAPQSIKHATIRLASFLYKQKDSQADLDRPLITGDGVTLMPSTVPMDVKKIIDVYRLLW